MFKVILALSMSSLLFISVANAQPKGGMMMAADELGLTEDQMDKLSDLRFAHQKEMIKKKAALQEAKLELRQLMRKAEVDKKTALSRQEKISAVKADLARMRLSHKLEMREVLTSEQLDKWMKTCCKHDFRKAMHRKGGCCQPKMGRHHDNGHGMGMRPPGEKPVPDHDFWD